MATTETEVTQFTETPPLERAASAPPGPADIRDPQVTTDLLHVGNQDKLMRRSLGWVSLSALTFSAMVGSGWLFASYYAARLAGPLALGSWVLCAVITVFLALCYLELGITRPIGGGNVRWPSMISGPFVGVLISWVCFLQSAVGNPSEASGLLQYASRWWPGLFAGERLSTVGLIVAALLLVGFTALNWFGVELMARVSNAVTIFKLVVPFLTVAMLLASGFHTSNIAAGGGVAPYGTAGMLTALTGAGLVYAFGGVQIGSQMASEVRNPRRDIPIGTFVGFGVALVLYLLLQTSYLGAVPSNMLAKAGWHGIDFTSPFAQLATLLNMGWLSTMMMVDSVVSPAGTAFVGIGLAGRNTYGMGQNHTFPGWLARIHPKSGVPRNALVVNLVISLAFLCVFQSWSDLVSALSMFFAVGFAVISVAAGANRYDPRLAERGFGFTRVVAPVSFVCSALIMYWAGWSKVEMALVLTALALPLYAILMVRRRDIFPIVSLKEGAWFVALMLFVGAISYTGSFAGRGWIPAPVDTIVVVVGSLACYLWALRSSADWLGSPEAARTADEY